MTPEQSCQHAAGRKQYLDGFHISFDNWHSTHSPENTELARQIYRDLRDRADGSLIEVRTIEQFFDPEKNMFLPDRYIKGECPKCHAKDQYGDNCEVCGSVYAPTDLINPYSALSGAKPELKNSEHYLLQALRSTLRGVSGELDARWQASTRSGQQDQRVVLRTHQPGRHPERRLGRLGHQPRRTLLRYRDS
uniref:Methionine--tRNA ligase n=1 Tax=Curvibacter symbiont subsp. Hydra magnipapillata TaxID=667019 RepID=C9Y8M3_CURXX|nr:hypothetical protein Csp_A04740 [Curvibacter putative symbiont of Hydra magnipapillata]